jgi:hypothetical protein
MSKDSRYHNNWDRIIFWGSVITGGVIVGIGLMGCGAQAADGPVLDTHRRPQPAETKFHRVADINGGVPGFTNASMWVTSVAGKDNLNYEWNSVAIIANYADKGENVAHYSQGLARGRGQTWASVSEVKDESPYAPTLVGHEVNVGVKGTGGERVGVHVVLSQANPSTPVPITGTHALRISSGPQGRWGVAIAVTEPVEAVLSLPEGTERVAVRVGNRIRYIKLED